MAEVKGVNVTKYDSGTGQGNWIEQGLIKSGLKVWSDFYEASGVAIGDNIVVARMPKGAVVHSIQIGWDQLGSGVLLHMGDTADGNRYFSNIPAGASTGTKTNPLVNGLQYKIGSAEGDDKISVLVT